MPLKSIVNTIFPVLCYKCGRPGAYFCYDCRHISDLVPEPSCPHCQKRIPYGKPGKECKKELNLDRIFSCANYRDRELNRLIKDLKYKYAYKLAEPLADFAWWWLQKEGYTKEFQANIEAVVPVPTHVRQLRRRGFNHAELIAKHLAGHMSVPVLSDVLIKSINTDSQVEAGAKEKRRENLLNAFSVTNKDQVAGKAVLLVDDVLTTGSTLRECAKPLRKAGVKEIWGLTVAKE